MWNGEKIVLYYQPENTALLEPAASQRICIPEDENNTDYARIMEEVAAGTATIEEVDDTRE